MRLIDLSGRDFGHLTVVERADNVGRHVYWRCVCKCGAESTVKGDHLKQGSIASCGCQYRRSGGHSVALGPHRSSRTYKSWTQMVDRTTNPKHHAWRYYGGRGITVCTRWRTFANFLADMGERPECLSLDRIDNERGYEPGNCRWATASEQRRNQRPRTTQEAA